MPKKGKVIVSNNWEVLELIEVSLLLILLYT